MSLAVVTALIFSACNQDTFNSNTLKSIVQSNSAAQIVEYKENILKHLVEYKVILDEKNPNSFNKALHEEIKSQIKNEQNYINIVQDGKKLVHFDDYFHYAFLSKNVKNRNDFLILGLYKLIYESYNLDKKHKFTAISYDAEKLKKLYKYLQVISWKIRNEKNYKNEYLFITWQKDWQLRLEKDYMGDLNIINSYDSVKSKKESIIGQSLFTFEVLIEKMKSDVEYSLLKVNIEPQKIGFDVAKTFLFL
ncbi:MAG: hypothetical protein ABF301_08095 [Sulfurovum sp.]|jgi:hypothetical protein